MGRRRKSHEQPPPEFIKELAEWLGRVVIAASQLEHFQGIALAEMFKLTRLQHRTLVIPLSISNKLSLFRQLGKEYLSPPNRKILKDIIEEIKKCAETRNSVIHGFYGAKKGKFELITHSGGGRFSGQPVSWTPKDLESLVKRITSARATVPQLRHLFPKRLFLPKNRRPIAPFENE